MLFPERVPPVPVPRLCGADYTDVSLVVKWPEVPRRALRTCFCDSQGSLYNDVVLVLLEALKTLKNLSRSKLGPKVCCGGSLKSERAKGAEKASRGETVVRFFSAPLRFSGVLRANFTGEEKQRTLQKRPFGRPFLRTTPSPLLWRTPMKVGQR